MLMMSDKSLPVTDRVNPLFDSSEKHVSTTADALHDTPSNGAGPLDEQNQKDIVEKIPAKPKPVRKRRNSKRRLSDDQELIYKSLSIDFSDCEKQPSSSTDSQAALTGLAVDDPVVSPVVLQPSAFKKRRQHHPHSYGKKSGGGNEAESNSTEKLADGHHQRREVGRKRHRGDEGEEEIDADAEKKRKIDGERPTSTAKAPDEESATSDNVTGHKADPMKTTGMYNAHSRHFRYGNYNQYYGKRIPVIKHSLETGHHRHPEDRSENEPNVERNTDPRLQHLKEEWFKDKNVLDVGCNIGLVTLYVAKHLRPKMIVGLDIDPGLIGVARKNVRHYIDVDKCEKKDEPADRTGDNQAIKAKMSCKQYFERVYGPLSAPPLSADKDAAGVNKFVGFPHNVMFKTANYVPNDEATLDMVQPEYDTIIAFSITKWVHLNWGDRGLKLFFKRLHNNLKPGGILLLEYQAFTSYKKRKKLTPEIFEHYKQIKLLPEDFNSYLLGTEVGFETCDLVANPLHKAKGFCRPMFIFKKKT